MIGTKLGTHSDNPSGVPSSSNEVGIKLGTPSDNPSGVPSPRPVSPYGSLLGAELCDDVGGCTRWRPIPDGSPLGTKLSAAVDSLLFEPVSFPHGELVQGVSCKQSTPTVSHLPSGMPLRTN